MALAPRLTITKPSRISGHRWIQMTCSNVEANLLYGPIQNIVLGGRRPKTRKLPNNQGYNFYVPLSRLDEMLLTFPYVEIAPVLEHYIHRDFEEGEWDVPDITVPGLVGELWDFQKIGVNAIVEALLEDKGFWLNDGLGLGKTLQVLSAIAILKPGRTLAIVPNNTKFVVWERLAKRFLPDLTVQIVEGSAVVRKEQIRKKADITVINYEASWRHPEIARKHWDMAVLDEAHRISNPETKQTMFIHDIEADKKLLVSGTPLMNGKLEQLWSPLAYCWPELWGDYTWFTHHFVAESTPYGPIAYWPKNAKVLREFIHGHSIRRRKEQVLEDIPEEIYLERYVNLTSEQRRLYEDLRDKFIMWLEDGRKKTVQQTRVKMLRMLQACFSPELYGGSRKSAKMDELKVILAEIRAQGEKAIVFSKWSRATRIMLRELGEHNPAYISGETPNKKRADQIDKFEMDPKCHLFIGTIGSNKEGVTLSKGSYVIFTDLDWVPFNNEQAIGRGPAGGMRGLGIEKATIITLLATDTVEIYQKEVVEGKRTVANMFIERDGGRVITPRVIRSIKEVL